MMILAIHNVHTARIVLLKLSTTLVCHHCRPSCTSVCNGKRGRKAVSFFMLICLPVNGETTPGYPNYFDFADYAKIAGFVMGSVLEYLIVLGILN